MRSTGLSKVVTAANVAAFVLVGACTAAAGRGAPPACASHPDNTGWRDVQIVDAPVVWRLPDAARRDLGAINPPSPETWRLPDSLPSEPLYHEASIRVDVRPQAIPFERSLRSDELAQPSSRKDVFECVAMVGTRPMRITTYFSGDLLVSQYAVDAVMPLVDQDARRSWLVFGGEAMSVAGQQTLVAALLTLRFDSVLAAASHPTQTCPTIALSNQDTSWVWHRFEFAPLRVQLPVSTDWWGTRGLDQPGSLHAHWWHRSDPNSKIVEPHYDAELIATPAWQLATNGPPPPYDLACRTTVAGHDADVFVDRLTPQYTDAHVRVAIGRDSVLRIRTMFFRDTAASADLLRMLSHIAPDTLSR
jgi:hypothetical protein